MTSLFFRSLRIGLFSLALVSLLPAADWPAWRGWDATGASQETGLPSSWSPDGENLLWKLPIGGRGTPVVMNGRVCVATLAEPGNEKRWMERIVCVDEDTGATLWDHRVPIYQTDIPHHRLGWGNLVGDPAADSLYILSVNGLLSAYDAEDGRVLWRRSLAEEVGRISGFGGRTVTPVVDGDLLITSFLSAGWGETRIPRHRFYAFNKATGETAWVSTPGGAPLDTTYSVPVVAEIGGQRLLLDGNADGGVYALQVTTGKKVWGFPLSKRGLNASVVVAGSIVYASHSEDNVHETTAMGRVVALDSSKVTDGTPELVWGVDGFTGGYASPAIANGILYQVDNSANLVGFDSATGEELWRHNLGIAQRGSPTVGDGKIFVMDVDGKFHILKDNGRSAPEILDVEEFKTASGTAAQTNGSPAIANGRVFFMTVDALYAIGPAEKTTGGQTSPALTPPSSAPAGAAVAQVRVTPSEVNLFPGSEQPFSVDTFDAMGRHIGTANATFALEGIDGTASNNGIVTVSGNNVSQGGRLTATVDGVTGFARIAVRPTVPYSQSFDDVEDGEVPAGWTAAAGRFRSAEVDGERVFVKPSGNPRTWRTTVFTGDPLAKDYVTQADVLLKPRGRRIRGDAGIVSNRYTLTLMGQRREVFIRSWLSELGHFSKAVPFDVEADVWYTMKFDVTPLPDGSQTVLRGKVWKRDEPEPDAWTIEAVHNVPHLTGSPGLYGYSMADIYYDNYQVTAKP